jgi:FtsP/CotA-like multicopper oxidase with cupredoxin domain
MVMEWLEPFRSMVQHQRHTTLVCRTALLVARANISDLGVYPVNDWFSHETAFQFLENANVTLQLGQGPAPADTILINGTNVNSKGGGSYSKVSLTPGKKHRLRIINTSSEAAIRVSLDNHVMQVIASDFVPVTPFTATTLLLAIGQRYDVVITANQTASNYWFRANVATDCASEALFNGKAIFSYAGVTVANPTSTNYTEPADCQEPTTKLVPYWKTNIASADFQAQARQMDVNLGIPNVTTNNQNIVSWIVNMTAIDIDWRDPTLQ